ncbi:hypothetical protein NBRC116599_04880 [Aquicoccus sp. SU-CL01552]
MSQRVLITAGAGGIADMAGFLAPDAARMVSGQVIAVDGLTVNPDPTL